jgi:hypothetical protein
MIHIYSISENIKSCAKWLDSAVGLSAQAKANLAQNALTSKELANELRSGELLCRLIRNISPDLIDLSQVNTNNTETSQVMSVFNINLFLNACRLALSDLDEKYYFDAEILFNFIDLKQEVITFLSNLSKCKLVKSKLNGFNLNSSFSNSNLVNLTNNTEDDDEYYTTNLDIYTVYAPTNFFFNNNDYNEICEAFKQSKNSKVDKLFQLTNVKIKSSEYVLRELIVTEESYINTLQFLYDNFIQPCSKFLSYENFKRIAINIDSLLKFHQVIYHKLIEASSGGQGKLIFFIYFCLIRYDNLKRK